MPKLPGFTKEQLVARALRLKKQYMKRNRQRKRDYERARRNGTDRDWWWNACRKAGIDV